MAEGSPTPPYRGLTLGRRIDIAKRAWHEARRLDDLARAEKAKPVLRTEVIQHCIDHVGARAYLEIGVRDPSGNFDLIDCERKVSVDPGVEFEANPVDFQMTSDAFFAHWSATGMATFDVIFIDGLHRAEQAARDIDSALQMIVPGGIVVLHDCNPPEAPFAREAFDGDSTAGVWWNGTTWEAAWAYFQNGDYEMRVVDTDWGVGVIDTSKPRAPRAPERLFFEFDGFADARHRSGYLVDWEGAKAWLAEGRRLPEA